MAKSVTVLLTRPEQAALASMAVQDLRPPAEQLRWLLLREAERRGILPTVKSESSGAKELNPQRAAAL